MWPATQYFVAQRESLASKFELRKIVLQKKKCFKLKLRENSHEVMVNTCNKARVVLQVAAREAITFFFPLEISTISGMHHTISRDRCPKQW